MMLTHLPKVNKEEVLSQEAPIPWKFAKWKRELPKVLKPGETLLGPS